MRYFLRFLVYVTELAGGPDFPEVIVTSRVTVDLRYVQLVSTRPDLERGLHHATVLSIDSVVIRVLLRLTQSSIALWEMSVGARVMTALA